MIDEYLERNKEYAASFARADLPAAPSARLAVVACMDARLDVYRLLGLEPGAAHVIRNAGGLVTDDVVRSLLLSQRTLGTREIALVQHTDCGLASVDEDRVRAEIREETGTEPPFGLGAFRDVEASVRRSLERVRSSPLIPHGDAVRGFVYDVGTGRLEEVAA